MSSSQHPHGLDHRRTEISGKGRSSGTTCAVDQSGINRDGKGRRKSLTHSVYSVYSLPEFTNRHTPHRITPTRRGNILKASDCYYYYYHYYNYLLLLLLLLLLPLLHMTFRSSGWQSLDVPVLLSHLTCLMVFTLVVTRRS